MHTVKTLHLYLTRQILASLLMTSVVFTVVLFGVSAWMNMEIAPRAWLAYRNLIRNFKVDIANACAEKISW
ncbi:MAG TPA: hypothetical protein VF437_02725 [Verrucomicrobiae bacterium]|jgi:hypothetical protein